MTAAATHRGSTGRAGEQAGAPAATVDGGWPVQAEGLWKMFGPLAALRGVSLVARPGERLAIMGPNGSGKSTVLRILATLLVPSGGRTLIGGLDIRREARTVRRYIGVVSHQTMLYQDLTARENLEFYAHLYDLPEAGERALGQLRLVGLEEQRDLPARELSRGMQQRLAIARALLHEPPVLLLDEPDTGLDQHWCAFLVELLARAAAEGRTVILTTHNLERSLDLADRLVVLNAGRVAFSARRDELDAGSLKEQYARHTGVTA